MQPALWSPRAILIPRTLPDRIRRQADAVTLLDSLLTHSRAALRWLGETAGQRQSRGRTRSR